MSPLLGNSTNTLGQLLTLAATSIVPVVTMAQHQEPNTHLRYTYPKMMSYEVLLKSKQQKPSDSDIVESFINTVMNESIDLAPEFSKIIEDNYWDLF